MTSIVVVSLQAAPYRYQIVRNCLRGCCSISCLLLLGVIGACCLWHSSGLAGFVRLHFLPQVSGAATPTGPSLARYLVGHRATVMVEDKFAAVGGA